MKDFIRRNIIFIAGTVATIALILGGVFFFSRDGSVEPGGKQISNDILVPKGSNITSGIVNGKYLPANSSAQLTLVEFGDYQCPACGIFNPLTKQIITEFAGKVNYVFRNFPLNQHANAPISSFAAEAAGLQGKFWEMHDKLFETQQSWSTSTDAKSIFIGYAKDLGLDVNQFKTDIDSQKVKDKVKKDSDDGYLVALNATPTFYLNGVKLELPANYDDFKKIIQSALDKEKISQTPAPAAYHGHFDLKVYLNGSRVNFGLAKYQSAEGKDLDPYIHVHDGNGNLVHVHKTGIPIGQLFNSLKMSFTDSCFTLDNGQKFCNSNQANLKMYVNGLINTDFQNYIPQDLDRILISFGPTEDNKLNTQINSVTDLSCIYSLKCPERGKPPAENCVGGVGSGCTD
ncbi:MAG: thioredoxin domain-containing protein [Candidatus Woesebacteria bacterium]|nr:MAG: thioredoxin domain-containing protein [Candidatus Woesebacteria bacterium]